MVFFFRIIAKDSKTDELPEVALRRSPATLHTIQEEALTALKVDATKKKSVSFKDDVTNGQVNRCENGQSQELINIKTKINNIESMPEKEKVTAIVSKTESIKMKFDMSNKNVSIIKSTTSSVPSTSLLTTSDKVDKAEAKQKKKMEKLEKKSRNESLLQQKDSLHINNSVDTSFKNVTIKKEKDEYDFEDDIDEKKLGFLNTFQLTAKRNLKPDYRQVDCPPPALVVVKAGEQSTNKRKNKESVKATTKKYKFHEMKTVNESNKYLSTKTSAGREISFDMSPKPLGSKPSLSKVKNDILQMQQKAEVKAMNELVKANQTPVNVKKDVEKVNEPIKPPVVQLIKPKKLPMLLPKSIDSMMPPPPPPLVSPIPFIIKKTEFKKSAISEISVTRIHDDNRKVYGPKSSTVNNVVQKLPSKINQLQPSVSCPSNFMTKQINDGFLSPPPPKQKSNNTQAQQQQQHSNPQPFMRAYGMPKLPKNIPANMVTPYGMRTPFYTPNSPVYSPNSPSYIPNFDAKPQHKYTNPSAYASFLQSMFNHSNNTSLNKSPPPVNKSHQTIHNNQQQLQDNQTRKRLACESSENAPLTKRKTPSPPQHNESDPKYISILNKINFPSSLSVTITNEQEENKKEHMRNLKQNVVNNNIEIIKLPEAELNLIKNNLATLAATNITVNANGVALDTKVPTEKRKLAIEPKKLVSILPAPAPNSTLSPPIANAISNAKESFQKKFLESLLTANSPLAVAQSKLVKKTKSEAENCDEEKKMPTLNVAKSGNAFKVQDNLPNLISIARQHPPLFKLPKKPTQVLPPRRQSVCLTTSKHDDDLRVSKIQKTKSLTPPPTSSSSSSSSLSSSSTSSAVACTSSVNTSAAGLSNSSNSSAIQFNMMLNGLMSVAAKSNYILPSLPEYANLQRTMLLEQLRQNVEKSNVLLAMQHHQINQLQPPPNNEKANFNSKKSN